MTMRGNERWRAAREQMEERSLVRCELSPAHEAQTLDELSAAAAVAVTVAAPHDAGVPDLHVDFRKYRHA